MKGAERSVNGHWDSARTLAIVIMLLQLAALPGCETINTLLDTYQSTRETAPIIDRPWDIHENDRKLLIVLVHGFNSSSEQAWGRFPSLITEQKDSVFAGFNVVRYGYGSSFCKNRVDIRERGAGLKSFLKDEISSYEGVIFVSHSMGGLVVMHSLTRLAKENNDNLKRLLITVMTFGTPHYGVKAADQLTSLGFLCSDNQAEGLRVFNDSLFELMSDWNSFFSKETSERYSYHVTLRTYYGERDTFVDRVSACGPYLECDEVDGNHVMMVKPDNTEHLAYKKLISEVRRIIAAIPAPAKPSNLSVE